MKRLVICMFVLFSTLAQAKPLGELHTKVQKNHAIDRITIHKIRDTPSIQKSKKAFFFKNSKRFAMFRTQAWLRTIKRFKRIEITNKQKKPYLRDYSYTSNVP